MLPALTSSPADYDVAVLASTIYSFLARSCRLCRYDQVSDVRLVSYPCPSEKPGSYFPILHRLEFPWLRSIYSLIYFYWCTVVSSSSMCCIQRFVSRSLHVLLMQQQSFLF